MKNFAKVFNTDVHGQVVVMIDQDGDGEDMMSVLYLDMSDNLLTSITTCRIEEKDDTNTTQQMFDEIDDENVLVYISPLIMEFEKQYNEDAIQ